MSDGFDPCECVFSHEAAMRRLLSLLRNTQNYCTDTECNQELPGPQGGLGGWGGQTMFFVMMMWMVAAVALFMLRPGSMRRTPQEKPPRDENGPNPPPPGPGVH